MRRFLASCLLVTSSAYAQPRAMNDAAKQELERGIELYTQQRYADAIDAFEAGHAIDPHPDFHYVKAQALRLSGDCESALTAYRAFLDSQPPAREAEATRKNIAKCEQILASMPPPAPVPVHEPELPARDAELEPAPRTEAPGITRTVRRAWWSDRLGLTLSAAGVAGLGTAAGFALAARAAADETALALDRAQWEDAHAAWQRNRIIAGVAAGAGATLIVLAAVRFSVRDRSVSVAAASGGGAIVAVGGAW